MNIVTDEQLIAFTGVQESQFIGRPSDWRQEVKDRLDGNVIQAGAMLPWGKTHPHVRLRPCEVSLWGGYNGHGKSQMLGMVTAWGLKTQKWLVASMEMPPPATIERMIRQMSGGRNPSDEYIDKLYGCMDDNLWIYDQTDSVKSDRILGLIHYAASELNVDHIVIDSLIKCGIGRDDYEAQAAFVDRICWAAKAHKIHVHIVHHMRKPHGDDDSKVPSKMDLRGAGEVSDLVDNVFIVHRNKRKEEKERQGQLVDPSEADSILKCDKQRHGEWEGSFKLWFHKDSMQYVSSQERRRMIYEASFN